jgi:hypothetical protein
VAKRKQQQLSDAGSKKKKDQDKKDKKDQVAPELVREI